MSTIPTTLDEAVALDIQPKYPAVLDAHPGWVLYDPNSGETWSLDPEDYRWYDGEPDEEVRGSMELAIESAWLDSTDEDQPAVLVPAHLV